MCKTSVIGSTCLAFGFSLASCSSDRGASTNGPDGGVSVPAYDAAGPAAVGVLTTAVTDGARGRTLPIEVWCPIESAGTASAVIEFETDPDQRTALSGLLDAAPEACVAKTTAASRDAGEYPLVLYSHCYTCTRWSAHVVMERLASHGFIVVAPDHIGDTLFDRLEGTESLLNNELVDIRGADIRFLLDSVLAGEILPDGIAANTDQVGMLGHSIGSVTARRVAENDTRIAAVVGFAAPIEVRE